MPNEKDTAVKVPNSNAEDTKNAGKNGAAKKTVPKMQARKFEGVVSTEGQIEFSKIFIPDWHNRPIDREPVLRLNDTPILTYQNITGIIANPGGGKTSICEATQAAMINRRADCLGLTVGPDCKSSIIADFERTEQDVWNTFYRRNRRAGISEGQGVQNALIAGFRNIPRLAERLKTLEYLLQNNPCDLLILDGVGDMVTDTNDLPQAIECRIFLRELTVRYNLSILTTLHPNPGSFKPRGHIGSEIHREAECVLLAKPFEGDVRIITSEFEHGKNRNSAPITAGFKWSDEHMMFISCDIEEASCEREQKKAEKYIKELSTVLETVLPKLKALTREQLEREVSEHTGKSKSTASRKVNDMLTHKLISKGDDGNYRNII